MARAALALSLALLGADASVTRAAPAEPWTSTGPDIGWITALLRPRGPGGPLLAGTFGGGVYQSDDDGLTWHEAGTGLGGRFVNALAADSRLFAFVYAGTSDHGLWRLDVTTSRWEGVNRGLGGNDQAPEVTGIAVDLSDPRTVLLSTSDGMWTSRNWGNDWPDSLRWLPSFTTFDAEIPSAAPQMHFGVESYGVWWTTNRGQTLHSLLVGLPDGLLEDLAVWPGSVDTLVVAAWRAGIFLMEHASRQDATWGYAGLVPKEEPHPLMRALAIAPQTHTLLAGSERGVHASTDLGVSWSQLPDGLGLSYPEVWALLVEEESPLTLALGTYTRGFLRTGPGGGEWVAQNTGLRAAWATSLCAWGDSLLAGTAHGRLFLSPDAGQTWVDRTGQVDELHVFGLLRLPSGRWLAGGNRQVWISDDRGANWRTVGSTAGHAAFQFVQPAWLDPAVIYAATSGGVLRSDDAGETFVPVPGLPHPTASCLAMAAAPQDSSIWLAQYGHDVYRGRDGGSFTAQGMQPAGTATYRVLALPTGGSDQVVVGTESALVRYDAGTPHDIAAGLPSPFARTVLFVEESQDLYVGLDGDGVWRSPDRGEHWEELGEGLGSGVIEALAVTRGAVPRLHAATLGASVRSRPLDDAVPVFFEGPRLRRVGDGVEIAFHWSARSRAGAPASTPAAAASWALYRAVGDGAWIQLAEQSGDGEVVHVDRLEGIDARPGVQLRYRVDLAEGAQVVATAVAEIVLDGATVPAVVTRLLPNVPNPFNPRTQARFQLARPGPATLEVVDPRGRRVALLLQRTMPAGEHAVTWDAVDDRGRALASGVYLLRLVADGRVHTRVITMLR